MIRVMYGMLVAVLVVLAVSLGGACAPIPDGPAAVRIEEHLGETEGYINFEIGESFAAASDDLDFDILASATVQGVALPCEIPSEGAASKKIWIDDGGYRWVRLGNRGRISYMRALGSVEVSIDGTPVVRCSGAGASNIRLGILFRARPHPASWSSDSFGGFGVKLPD